MVMSMVKSSRQHLLERVIDGGVRNKIQCFALVANGMKHPHNYVSVGPVP
jgi:hypothetical protein